MFGGDMAADSVLVFLFRVGSKAEVMEPFAVPDPVVAVFAFSLRRGSGCGAILV